MSLEAGQSLLHYRLVEKIGEGGMGVVWKALDTTLDREVAIKLLPGGVTGDPDQLARFVREAKLLASLNHPHIAAVRAFHETDGQHFIEMELVDGEELAARLGRGPLPIAEARRVGAQIAEALEAAHEAGVIHRDLKPANIKLTPDGQVKVLDFGLAKAFIESGSEADRAASPTLTSGGTFAGAILGTAAYMSPEQARGEALDKRTDIWSFGCVLYECLTGQRAFQGNTTGDAISSVLRSEPELGRLPARTPAALVRLLGRCLIKPARGRLRDIGDARLELEDLDDTGNLPASPSGPGRRQRTVLTAAVVVLAIALAASLLTRSGDTDRQNPTPLDAHWRISVPDGGTLDWHRTSANLSKLGGGSPVLALSPDGRTIVFSVAFEGGSRFYRQQLDQLEAEPIDGTEDGRGPFFSPDGQWIGFLANNSLQVVPLDRGGARRVCDVSSQNFAGSWAPDGEHIVYSTNTGLWRVSVQGGTPERLAEPRRADGVGEFSLSSMLPDGSAVLYTTGPSDKSEVGLLRLDDGNFFTIAEDAAHAYYLETGHLVYAHANGLWKVPFDPEAGTTHGTPTPLIEGVYTTLGAGGSTVAHYAVAASGTLVYVPGLVRPTSSALLWVDRSGAAETIIEGPGRWEHPRISPDGQRMALDILDRSGKGVYILELARGQFSRLTEDWATTAGLWTRDGSRIFGSDLASNGIISAATDFSGDIRRLPNPGHTTPGGWTADGRTLVFAERDAQANWAIGSVRVDRDGAEPQRLLGSGANERWPAMSPDGSWLAYVADERGLPEVFVRPFPALDRKIKLSVNGGGEPLWSGDGSELFYRYEGQLFVVAIDRRDGFRPGLPQKLFDAPYDAEPNGHQHYDVSRDGRRFAMIRLEESAPRELRVVTGLLP